MGWFNHQLVLVIFSWSSNDPTISYATNIQVGEVRHDFSGHTVDGSEIPNNHRLDVKKPIKYSDKLPFPQPVSRISEPSTVSFGFVFWGDFIGGFDPMG